MGFRCFMDSEQRSYENSAVVSACNPQVSNAWINIVLSVSYNVRLTCSALETFRMNILLIPPGCIYILASSIIL